MPSATDRSPSVLRQPSKRRPRAQSPPAKRRRTTPPPSTPRSPSPRPSSTKWFRKPSVVWYRGNDLRVEDHPALFTAAQRGGPVVPLFVWDPSDGFGAGLGPVKQWWLRQSLQQLQNDLRRLGVQLYTRKGRSTEELRTFLVDTGADAVFWNRCYEPQLLKRDEELREELAQEGFTAESFKAELLVEPWELSNSETSPRYETFHAYMTTWMTVAPPPHPLPSPSRLQPISRIVQSVGLDCLGFDISDDINDKFAQIWKPGSAQAKLQLDRFLNDIFPTFGESRCRQHCEGTSRLSPHIRFGEISPRRMYHATRLRVSRWDHTTLPKGLRIGPRSSASPQKRRPAIRDKPGDCNVKKLLRKPGNESVSNPSTDIRTQRGRRSGSFRKQGASKDKLEHEYVVLYAKSRLRLPHISQSARAFLKNLCLRDFSFHILYHFPDVNSKPLIPEFSMFPWAEDNGLFDRWRNGVTGYPIIDAAMRQLRESGWVHNRMRFLLACFLTKYLLLPWSKGLRLFYRLLVDGDHSANALGWQWTAGTNSDAFPVTTLVNPVKQAYRQDPNGDYVRRWLPELAKLPTEYIHRPWEAPQELLAKCGIRIGDTYPKRVVDRCHAMRRAVKAMTVMKQIFAANTVWKRRFRDEGEKLVEEWPEIETEDVRYDESNNPSGKGYLLPSIWALLQSEQSPSYIQGSSRGGDCLIPMDTTACLADGALPIPMVDQPESIEQALISAHEYVDPHPQLSSEALLSPENRGVEAQSLQASGDCEQSDELFRAKSEDIEQIGEPVKYTGLQQIPLKEEEKPQNHFEQEFRRNGSKTENEKPGAQRAIACVGNDTTSSDSVPDQEMLASRSTGTSFPKAATRPPGKGDPTAANEHIPEAQQFLNQQDTGIITPSTQNARRDPFPSGAPDHPPTLSGSVSSQPINRFHGNKDVKAQQVHRTRHHQHTSLDVQHGTSEFVEVPFSSQQLQESATQLGKISPSHYALHQSLPTSTPIELDTVYAARLTSAPVHVNHPPTVPMSPNPLVMSSVMHANDIGSAHIFGTPDSTNPPQPHHVRTHQFYGVGQFVPMMSAHPMNSGARPSSIQPAPTQSQKVGVPGMFPLTYGVYGNSLFDQSMFTGHVNPARLPTNVYPPQSHPATCPQVRAPEIPSHQVIFQMGPRAEMRQPQTSANLRQGQQNPSIEVRGTMEEVDEHIPATPLKVAPPGVAGHVAQDSGSSHHTGGQEQGIVNPPRSLSNRYQVPGQAPRTNESIPTTRGYVNAYGTKNSSGTGTSQHARVNAKSSSKSRSSSRAKRSRQTQGSSSRGKNDGKRIAKERLSGNVLGSNRKSGDSGSGVTDTTPKNRQQILESVFGSEDHEYRGFAQYLLQTYEFTGNTNWQTSRDYVRLCNLKDDYHKKCNTEKGKLKIYRIKDFFSKVLKLEVTGEWDRHNHGGVRGPYVYGIRLKQQAKSQPG